jgi:hypothetical protein
LVLDLQVTGVAVHDARIAANMLDANIEHILTFNGGDFGRYAGLIILEPQAVAAGAF